MIHPQNPARLILLPFKAAQLIRPRCVQCDRPFIRPTGREDWQSVAVRLALEAVLPVQLGFIPPDAICPDCAANLGPVGCSPDPRS